MRCFAALAFLAGAALSTEAFAQATSQQLASGLALPNTVVSPRGDFSRIFIIEQRSSTTGRIRIFRNGAVLPTPFLSVSPVTTGSEQGLLGLAFHPNYATNGKFYVNFTNASGSTIVREYTRSATNPDEADPTSARDILTIIQPQENHNGGWMDFGPDGFLYIATGDGGGANDTGTGHTSGTGNAQDITSNLLGKILRIDIDRDDFPADASRNYGIPSTNPYVGVTGDDEIFAFGLRNPWRNSFDRATGDIWIADVGQDAEEEVNAIPAGTLRGRNFGWRCMEGFRCTGLTGCTCNAGALTMPVHTYLHAGSSRCSVTGGFVYRGCAIPALQGFYIFSDYCTGEIFARNPQNGAVSTLFTIGFGVTSFGEDSYGELYFVRQNGRFYKIVPSGAPAFLDCNTNGRPDCWDIADGTSSDNNQNGVPDSCDPPCPADFNGDGFADFFDFDAYVDCFENAVCPPGKSADFDGDGFVDFFDFDGFVAAFEVGC